MVMRVSLPVALSLAVTLRMPLASMSKVTSICGTPRGAGRNAAQLELAQGAVLRRHGPLALQHVHLDLGLRVGRRREGLGLLGGDGGVARNHRRGHAAQRLDGQGQRSHVEQQQILDLAGQHAGLHRGADGDHLVGVDAAMRLAAEELLHQLLNLGHAGLAAHQHHFVDLVRR